MRKFAKFAAAGQPRYWVIDDEVDLDVGPARVRFKPRELLY